jgi:hypothetical protein
MTTRTHAETRAMPDPSELEEEGQAGFAPRWRQGRTAIAEGLAITFWGCFSFVLTFVELVAEIAAPLVLFTGGLWWLALRLAGNLPLDQPEIRQVLAYLPSQFPLGSMLLTPGRLVLQGLVLLAVVAACRTVKGIIDRES